MSRVNNPHLSLLSLRAGGFDHLLFQLLDATASENHIRLKKPSLDFLPNRQPRLLDRSDSVPKSLSRTLKNSVLAKRNVGSSKVTLA